MAEHALDLDMGFHGRRSPGEMIERVDGDVVAVADFVVAFLLDAVVSLLLLTGVLLIVLATNLQIGGILLAYCLVIGLAMAMVQLKAAPSAAQERAKSAALIGDLEERLAGAEDLKANGAGKHAIRRLHQTSGACYRAGIKASWISTGLIAGTSMAFAAGTALILVLAAWNWQSGTLSIGTAVLLFQYTQMVRAPFERLIDQLKQYQGALGSITRIGSLLAERSALSTPKTPRPLPAAGPLALALTDVDFAYADDGNPVLSKINIKLAPDETLGLVGRTGSGKTTIGRLALRLYDPSAGVVRVGGVDLRDVDRSSLRQRVGVVTQEVQLFTASVRDNLTLFRPIADDDRLTLILRDVGLGDWLAGLPDGLDTQLGGEAAGLSAGEGQLLALARAFLTDPGLVVLDEASSRLDPATERRIEEAIDRLLDGRTAVIIAHRLSSLSKVDQIMIIDQGRVIETGRRADLVADPDSRFFQLLETAEVA